MNGPIDWSKEFSYRTGGGGSSGSPVKSVNGQTGDVVLDADDVGARSFDSQKEIDDAQNDRIDALETSQFPNVTIVGEPLIVGSNVSRFTAADYLIFPFILDVRGKAFTAEFTFRTGADVIAQQNILDSRFGLALAVQNQHGVMALSSDGLSWDIGVATGSILIEPNSVYHARLTWDGSVYVGSLSTDGDEYTEDMRVASTKGLHPETIYIGAAPDLFGSGTSHPFGGGIDMSSCRVTISGLEVWHGMDNASLASRANVSLSNLDAIGEARFANMTGIDDYAVATDKTWSSDKINSEIDRKLIDFEATADDRKIYGFIEREDILSPGSRIIYTDSNFGYAAMTMSTAGVASYGSWDAFPFLMANKPYMVRDDGTADYELNPADYTKRLDGTDSDVANLDYEGGAFSWIPKIYKKEWKSGHDRHVQFSMFKHPGFEAVGFKDENQNELPGVWLPMFYGSIDANGKMRSISGTQPVYNKTTAAEKTAIDKVGPRARFFGGSIVNTLNDLLTMFFKTSNCDVFGKGNQSGYNASLAPTNGVLANDVVSGGQFYGTQDAKSLNKLFHSVVLGTYQQWQRDPYTLGVNGVIKVSPYYQYDLTGSTYIDTGCPASDASAGWKYPSKHVVIPDWGMVPTTPYDGSTSMGNCDGLYLPTAYTGVKVSLRFGSCSDGADAGLRAMSLYSAASRAIWYIGASVFILPPV